ncbi:MAG: Sec-independent protein translocase protein TatB [Pseudomonadota bacterium]
MFDIAWTEILLVAVIAILVVGPKELPGMLRAFGKTFGQVRRTAREFQSTFNDALREAERQASLDDVKKDLDAVRSIDPTKDVRKGLMQAQNALKETVTDEAKPKPAVASVDEEKAPRTEAVASADETTTGDVGPMEAPQPLAGTDDASSPAPAPDEEDVPRAAAGADRR